MLDRIGRRVAVRDCTQHGCLCAPNEAQSCLDARQRRQRRAPAGGRRRQDAEAVVSVAHGITGRMVCFVVSSVRYSSLASRT
jgi:hypothetical protein